jgi:riboflavin synthase
MFTGIIKETGKVINVNKIRDGIEIEVSCSVMIEEISEGDSVCVNGVCLTVKKSTENSFFSDISFSTLSSTSFKDIKPGSTVNLEDSLKLDDRLGGHFVTGHIDCITDILEIEKHGDFYRIKFRSPENILPYIAQKGSIAIEGISLTVENIEDMFFSVVVIPYTFNNTTLKSRRHGDEVNLEVDLIARYVSRFISQIDLKNIENKNINKDEILKEKLIKYGFYK